MDSLLKNSLVAVLLVASAVPAQASQNNQSTVEQVAGIADRLTRSISDSQLRSLVAETLERNPEVAVLMARARAAAARAPQVKGLPDPVLGATAWVRGPETRTGPQILTLSLMQPLPWLGKFDAEEQAAMLEAEVLVAQAEARRVELVTDVRRDYFELAFLARQRAISQDYVDHLRQHEKISQSRYATGTGSSQDVVKIQAEITLAEKLLIDIDRRRVGLEADINALRDLRPSAVVLPAQLPSGRPVDLDYQLLLEEARVRRPEVVAADVSIARSQVRSKRVEKQSRPDFGVGVTYTLVDRRQDEAGLVVPPEGNGEDIFGIQGAISIPIWRKKLNAGMEEAGALEVASREAKRGVLAGIDAAIGDLMQRIPLTWQQLRLLEDILILQAEESVRSAQSGYVSGSLNALDLLDAEHVFFDTETAIARARADYAIYLAELEGTAASPIKHNRTVESTSP